MSTEFIFIMWVTMITAIYGSILLWLAKSVMDLNDQMQYLYSLLEEDYEDQRVN